MTANVCSQVDDSGSFIFTVLGRDMAADLRRIKNCVICYGELRVHFKCSYIVFENILMNCLFTQKSALLISRSFSLLCALIKVFFLESFQRAQV